VDWTNQASNRYRKAGIILVLCLCAWNPLSAVIVMETPQTEVKIAVFDRLEERNSTPSSSLMLPLCSIVITAKHHGKGYLQILHTPLSNGVEQIPYQLFCDNRGENLADLLSYECSPFFPLTIPMTRLSVKLTRALKGQRTSYRSDIFLYLTLEA